MSRPGFTLIELMIYLTLLGLIGIGIASAYNFFLTSSIETRSVAELRASSKRRLIRCDQPEQGRPCQCADRQRGQQCAIATTREKTSRSGLDFNGSVNLSLSDTAAFPAATPAASVSGWCSRIRMLTGR